MTPERQLKNAAPRVVGGTAGYPRYWVWLAILGIAVAAAGFVAGVLIPGPLTGILFPVGITMLLIVVYGARERGTA